jgi:hypothetical protein
MTGYPACFVNDWCGDHKLDEKSCHEQTVRPTSPCAARAAPPTSMGAARRCNSAAL